MDGLDLDQLAQTTAAVVADTGAAGIPAADVIEQFLDEKCAFVIASTGAGIMPVVDKAGAEHMAAARPRAVMIKLVTVEE